MIKAKGLLFLSLVLLGACKSASIYYTDLSPKTTLAGTVQLVSCQIKKDPVAWVSTDYAYRRQILRTLPFEHPEIFLAQLEMHLASDLLNRLQIQFLEDNVVHQRATLDILKNNKSRAMQGMLPAMDQPSNRRRLDRDVLAFYTTQFEADYFLVIDGAIIDFEIPTFFNFRTFSLTYELSFVIYDREGHKVFSKHFKKRYKEIEDDHLQPETYYRYLGNTVELFFQEINEALSGVLP